MSKILPKKEKLVPISEAAEVLGVSIDTVRRWDEKGILASSRPDGKNRYFSIEELEKVKFSQPLTISEVAERFGISTSTLRRLEKKGLIKPERSHGGQRRYSRKTLEDFLNSEYFLRKKGIEEKILEPLKEEEEKQEEETDEHKVLGSLISDQREKIFKLLTFRKTFYAAGLFLVAVFVLLVFIITVLFLLYPEDTAEFFGYKQRPQIISAVLGARYPQEQKRGAVLGKALKPISRVSLGIVRQIDEETYAKVVEERIEDVNDIFAIDPEGNIAPRYNIKFPDSSYLLIPDAELVENFNAQYVQGKGPGTREGDLVVFGASGTISQLSITAANLTSGSVTSGAIADGAVASEDLADGAVTKAKIADDSITNEKIEDGAITTSKLAAGVGGTPADNSVTSSKIKDNEVSTSDLAATLTFAAGDYIDLSAVTHGSSSLQGLRLPNVSSASPTSPSSGEGFIAWDTLNSQILTYNGSAWATISGGGVTSITGTANQVIASASTGDVTLSLPQSIHSGATPTFAALTLSNTSNQLTFGSNGTLTWSPSAARTLTLPDATDTLVGRSTTDTLSNKTLSSPTITGSPTAAGATWVDLGAVTTIDIDGGTIDGTTIGGTTAAAGTFTTLTANTSVTSPTYTGSAAVTVSSGGTSNLTLDAAGNLVIADATVELTGGTTTTIQRNSATGDILALNNAGAGSLSLNLSDGGLQTGGTSRLTNAGALENITGLTVSSGTVSLPAGQIDNSELVNSSLTVTAGSGLTGGGAISLGGSATLNIGAGTGITVNADDIAVNQDTAFAWTNAHTFTLAEAEDVALNWSVSGTQAGQAGIITITNSSTSGNQYGLVIDNAASTGTTEALLVLDNSDTDTAVTAGIQFINAGGGFTIGIDMANLVISNIGAAGTDFTSTGGLTLADGLTLSSGGITVTGTVTTGTNQDLTLDADGTGVLVLGDSTVSLTGGTTTTIQRNSTTADVVSFDNAGTGTLSINIVDGEFQLAGTTRISNTGAGTLASLTSTGSVTIGSGGNTFTFDSAVGPVYAGTARPTKKITLSPEYEGVSFSEDDGTAVTGSLTSDTDGSANAWRNFYQWSSSQIVLNEYSVIVRVTLPEDFADWTTTNALQISYKTSGASNADSSVTARINHATDTPGTVLASSTDQFSTSWATIGFAKTDLVSGTAPEWDAAGETAVIRLKLKSKNSNAAFVGDVVLNYLAKY